MIENQSKVMVEKKKSEEKEKRQKMSEEAFVNISLNSIIERFSIIPHTLRPEFVAPYFVLLLAKKIACRVQKEWKRNKCFCHGCLHSDKYQIFLLDNEWLLKEIEAIYQKSNLQLRINNYIEIVNTIRVELTAKKTDPTPMNLTKQFLKRYLNPLLEKNHRQYEEDKELCRSAYYFSISASIFQIYRNEDFEFNKKLNLFNGTEELSVQQREYGALRKVLKYD